MIKKNINMILIISISFFLSSTAFCQTTKENELSNAEKFSARAGTLIEKQFIDIGQVKNIELKVLRLKDLNNNSSTSALRFEYEHKSSYLKDNKIASLDSDEIEGLIKSIKNLQTFVFNSVRETYTEVTFTSRTGFEAGCYYSLENKTWTTYVQLKKYDKDSLVFLNKEDFGTLLSLIEQAKVKMF